MDITKPSPPIAGHIDPHSLPFTPLPLPISSSAWVKVSILINGRFSANPQLFVLKQDTKENHELDDEWWAYPVFCFLVEKQLPNGKTERTLFELGIRKDRHNFSPNTSNTVIPYFPPTDCPDIVESLSHGSLTTNDIDTVILSHDHFDHVGDPSLFPPTTTFIIGDFTNPGAEESLMKALEDFATPVETEFEVEERGRSPMKLSPSRGSGMLEYGQIMKRSSSMGVMMERAYTTTWVERGPAGGRGVSPTQAEAIKEEDEESGHPRSRRGSADRGRASVSGGAGGVHSVLSNIQTTSTGDGKSVIFEDDSQTAMWGGIHRGRRSVSHQPSSQRSSASEHSKDSGVGTKTRNSIVNKISNFQEAFKTTLLNFVAETLSATLKPKRLPWKKLLLDPTVNWQPLGSFNRAHDYYGDGSFWLIDAPGHCQGHIMALARTTINPPTYILFASDSAHAKCLYSPCPPMPESPDPRHLVGLYADGYKVFPDVSLEEQTMSVHDNLPEAYNTIARLSRMDLLDNVFIIAAHETELERVVKLFPESANDWLVKGWKQGVKEEVSYELRYGTKSRMFNVDSGVVSSPPMNDASISDEEDEELVVNLGDILNSPIERTGSCSSKRKVDMRDKVSDKGSKTERVVTVE
ncbi:hypothetical protein BCR33DRAFT_856261 [Rhizoclosmatium globosum]|uniref:Metallo-beta-lactamase domain-containing protein n=1 Tax=Rhizoclosmatium globosum TaxID=329046 RepID=A0A1Y2BFY3_9FUNG|nr:hypothetical protein BCR33DRAFT_856261 [Rhizoclosmatium globosum]|eukprot:ORY33626.1 hypothetical protein BCR33DRAFT_856261 [Rhizoclosmatium globosum]